MTWCLTGLLFVSITGTLTDARCHCNTAAACAVFPSTPCSQDGCQDGWFGPYCQKRNIALGRNATQSSTYSESTGGTGYTLHRFEARYAVDGRTTTDFYSKPLTCSCTNDGYQTWTVYLDNSNTDKIQHVKLYLRQDYLSRNNGMKIYVGGQLCFKWSTDTYPPATADVKCQQALKGNNLTIQTNKVLTLCEVQIFVCSDGWFGEDCDKQCHCSQNTEVCEKITGHCLSGCAPGYMGIDCQTGCQDGYYGNCISKCGNCLNAAYCDKDTGICPGGCAAGWHTDKCLQHAECHCNTVAACTVFPSTPCSQVGDPDRCQEGWFGPYCQRRIIALGRNATQSSTYSESTDGTGNKLHRFEARYAVDGIATTDFFSKPLTCTYTNSGDQTWTVYLDNSNTDKIQQIKLYLRQDYLSRNNGMKIYVGGQLCFQRSMDTYPPATADVKCQQALKGNNLTIQTNKVLTLCEVQIFVCSDGWFGEDCDKQCHCSQNTEVCEKITGHCLSGCAPGYMEIDCQAGCQDGYYGNCTSKCGNCLNAAYCDKDTGICPLGCAAGWHTDKCLQPCPEGRYGANCTSPCGHCMDTDVCDTVIGKCPGGCQSGWLPDLCSQACSDGRHGHHCQTECGQCKGNLPCNKINGTCHQGCQPGFQEPFCKECVDGMYGDDCMSRCGQCKDALSCDKSSGECPEGCQGCTECPATSGYSNQVVPVAATLGTLLVLALIALLTAIIYIRRLKIQLDASQQKKPEDNYISLDEKTRDAVMENTYEPIDNTTPYINVGNDSHTRI